MSANSDSPEPERPASIEARYAIERTLGQGANGVVYQVLDRETGERLALKKLLRMDRVSVARLKHEFRALANLHHPNLVKLYEMGRADDTWFITMEHLGGTDLLSHLSREVDLDTTVPLRRSLRATDELSALCSAFTQLARGIEALHRAGMLHRDLKPSNVMVVRERVVLLDFGLVHELGERSATLTQEESVAGTPAYMAPEQVQGDALSEASDWYAYGVMLYEAISGNLPISGKLMELLDRKVHLDPKPLSELMPGCPAALSELCALLLSREPAQRPGFEHITRVLSALSPALPAAASPGHLVRDAERLSMPRHAPRPRLFGRARELAQLEQALTHAQRGQFSVAHVLGPSGAGKSALVEHFLEELELRSEPGVRELLVLRARCYEREAMPFKALDGLMDALVRHLAKLDELIVGHMLPAHLPELVRAFPVIERLPSVQRLVSPETARGALARERQRAEEGLFDLLRRVAAHATLVLAIDDLQWGDLDSVRILRNWIERDQALPLLLVLAYRGEERDGNACLKLLAAAEPAPQTVQTEIGVALLSTTDVEGLCQATLGSLAPSHDALVQRIVHEAHGSPFLAWQLLTLAQARIAQGDADPALSLGGLVSQLSGLLTESERALLNLLAVAGRPIAPRVALAAAHIRHKGRSQLHTLQGLGLVRMRIASGERLIELYHDRVRESVVEALSERERVQTHQMLLAAVSHPDHRVDPDFLHLLAVGARDDAAAVRYGLAAARRAEASLAFERAAELYRDCLTRAGRNAADRGALCQKLGDALAACGRGARAAEAYLEAAELQPGAQALTLTQQAATHLIRTGRFAQGEALVRKVLEGLHIQVPRSQNGLIAAIGWERARLALRGLAFTRREESAVDPVRLREARTYATLSIDTQAYDPLRAALFESRSLRIALELGVPAEIANALCAAATLRGVSGTERAGREAERLLSRAEQIAIELTEPLLHARVQSARAMCAFLLGRVKLSVELSEGAEQLYQDNAHTAGRLPAEYYHRFAVNAARIGALFQLGQLRPATRELRQTLQEARNTENRTAQLHLTMVVSLDDIAQGRAARSRARLDTERPQLPEAGFGPLHLLHIVAVMRVAAALSDFAWEEQALAQLRPQFERSLLRHGVLAQLVYASHARVLLNRHVIERRGEDLRRTLEPDLRAMSRRPEHIPPVMYLRAQARLGYVLGAGREQVVRLYREHVQACIRAEYADELARGRWALGRVLADAEGAVLCREAEASLAEIGFADPQRDLASHFPELS